MFSWCAFLFTATSVYSFCQYLPLLLGFLTFFSELIYLFRNYNVFAFLHLTLRHHRSKHCLVVTFFWDVPVLSWDLLVIPRMLLWHQSSKKKKTFDYWNIQIFIFCNVIWFSVSGFRYSFVYIATCHHKLQMWSLSLQSLLLLTIIFSLSGCFIHTVLTELHEKLWKTNYTLTAYWT